jgi:hypothetical protein
MTNDTKKLYRVDWRHTTDIVPGQFFDEYMFVAATSEVEATSDLFGTDFRVREATIEEIEAYVRGYEDGYDSGVVTERLHSIDDSHSVSIDDLKDL